MYKNTLRLASMLFVGLALTTACSKNEGASSALTAAVEKAKEVEEKIKGFDVSNNNYNTQEKVCTAAKALLQEVKTKAEAAKSGAKEEAKKEIKKATDLIDAYTEAKGGNVAAEKVAAENVAKQVVEALEKAGKAS